MKRTGNLRFMQEINRALMLDAIRKNGPISRVEIARKIGISPTTVTGGVNQLLDENLIYEQEADSTSVGRKPTMLQFSPNSKFLVCISITEAHISIGKLNLEAKPLTKRSFELLDGENGEVLLKKILQIIDDFIAEEQKTEFIGISLTLPGIVKPDTGEIKYAPKLNLTDFNAKKYIQDHIQLPVWVENNVNAIVLGEKRFGLYSHHSNIIYVKWEEGIGAGFLLNNHIYEGSRGVAGELGHMSVNYEGPQCHCGNTGCLELYIGWKEIKKEVDSEIGQTESMLSGESEITPYTFNQAVQQGDMLANQILSDKKKFFTSSLINLIHIINPEAIILGGDLIEGNLQFIEGLKRDLNKSLMAEAYEHLDVYPSSFGQDAGLVGAAAIALEDIFKIPV